MNAHLFEIAMMVRAKDYLSACSAALAGDDGLNEQDRHTLELGKGAYCDPEFMRSLGHPVEYRRQQAAMLLIQRYTMPAEGLAEVATA